MAGVRHVLYKRCVAGDRRKVKAQSNNDAHQGGGARDLRFNPWPRFEAVIANMFTNVRELDDGRKVYSAPVYWYDGSQKMGPCTVEFWSPTQSRPSDGRLSKVHLVTPFDEQHLPAKGLDPFFLLWQDTDDVIWAKYVTVPEFGQAGWAKSVVTPILNAVKMTPAGDNIRGWVNVQTGMADQACG